MKEMKSLTIGGNTYEIVDKKARDSIPTKTSDLRNNSGFIKKADIPTIGTYELIGETPLTLENDSNIKIVSDSEVSYSILTPTVWNFDDAEFTLYNVEMQKDKGYYEFVINNEGTTGEEHRIDFVISGLEVGRNYKFIFDVAGRPHDIANRIWNGYINIYSGTEVVSDSYINTHYLKDGNYEFTAQDTSVSIRYVVAMNNETPYVGWISAFNKIYLNYADMSDELTEIYNNSGTFTDVETFKFIPSGAYITTEPIASVYLKSPTDKSLTQSNVPADAEVTGKEIAEVKSYLPLFGKTVVNFGDDIFGNVRPPQDISTILAEKTGAEVLNCAFGFCRMSQHPITEYNAFSMFNVASAISSGNFKLQEDAVASKEVILSNAVKDNFARLKTIDFSKIDIVTIAYGANDQINNILLDNEENLYDITTIGGALRYSIEQLLTAYPNLRIFVLSTTWRYNSLDNEYTGDSDTITNSNGLKLADYNTKLKEVAVEYNLPFVDNYNIGINKFNYLQYFSTANGTQHQIEGRKLIAEHLAGALTSCVSGDYTPIKGIDYFTEEDKTELVNSVLASLPTWSGGKY